MWWRSIEDNNSVALERAVVELSRAMMASLKALMQKSHPNRFAVAFKILPDCPFEGLSIYARFSQSVTCIGLSATVSGQRRPVVSALPLGSKY